MCAALPTDCTQATVDASGRVLCTTCASGFVNLNYQCVSACPSGTMSQTIATTNLNALINGSYCVPCSPGCSDCTSTGCTTCNAVLGFTANGTGCSMTNCVNQTGTFYNTSASACQTCVTGCQNCSGASTCQVCTSGMNLFTNSST